MPEKREMELPMIVGFFCITVIIVLFQIATTLSRIADALEKLTK